MVADHFAALLQRLLPPHVQPYGSIKLQCPAPGGGFRVPEHNPHLFTELVNKNYGAVGLADNASQFTQGLGHKPGLKPHMAVAHLAVDLRFGHQSRYRVHNHNIHCAGADHGLGNLQSLLPVVRLGNIEVVNIHADILGIHRVQRMLRVDKPCNAAPFLHLSHHVEGNRRLSAGLRPVNLNHPALGHAAQAQGNIQAQGPGRDSLNIHMGFGVPQFHNGTFPIGLFDLGNSRA